VNGLGADDVVEKLH